MIPRVVLPPGLPWPFALVLRRGAASVLLAASHVLDRCARRLAAEATEVDALDASASRLEFHADAGAPEGALYVDGKLVAFVPGVARL